MEVLSRQQSANVLCCLDYAKLNHGGSYQESLVEDTKSLGKMFLVFMSMIPYWTVYYQVLKRTCFQLTLLYNTIQLLSIQFFRKKHYSVRKLFTCQNQSKMNQDVKCEYVLPLERLCCEMCDSVTPRIL